MNNIFHENIIASIGIIVSLFAIIATIRLLRSKDKANKGDEISDNFSNIFDGIKASINQSHSFTVEQIIDDILLKSYPEQYKAMKNLRRQSGFFKSRRFSKAWQEYVDPEDCGSNEPFLSYR